MKKSTIILIASGIGLLILVVVVVATAHAKAAVSAPGTKTPPPAKSEASLFDQATAALNSIIGTANHSRPINVGSTGAEVKALQDALRSAGYYFGTVDGIWGKDTTDAYNNQCIAWNMAPVLPITLDKFDAMSKMASLSPTNPVV